MGLRPGWPARRAPLIAAFALCALFAVWAFAVRPAPLRQAAAELSGYSIRGAVYDPRTGGTVGGFAGSAAGVSIDGVFRHDLLIAQKEGRRISRISRHGAVMWTRATRRWVTGLELFEGAVIFSEGNFVTALDPANGQELWREDLGAAISGIGHGGDRLLIANGVPNGTLSSAAFRGSVRVGLATPTAIEGTDGLAFARHAAAARDRQLVADTFNHRVLVIRDAGRPATSHVSAYFPNQIQMLDDNSFLVVEEHANRIVRHDPATGDAAVILSCRHPLFQTLSSAEDIRAGEMETGRRALFGLGARSVCDSRIDPDSLYSPNGFHAADDSTIYVADTDNHRVAMFDSQTGSVQATVTRLNSPVRVIAVPAVPVE